MPLDGNALGIAIQAAIDALSAEDKRSRPRMFAAMGNAIANYINPFLANGGLISEDPAGTVKITGNLKVTGSADISGDLSQNTGS